jgi:hypothetical protein
MKSKEKNTQNDSSARGSASKATTVSGPATGGRLGGSLKGGFVTGDRKARGKA